MPLAPLAFALWSFAPNVPAGTWPEAGLPVSFALAASGDDDFTREAASEVDVALRTWSRVPCTRWRARFEGILDRSAADDGVNLIVVHRDAWPADLPPAAVAHTVIATDASGRYRDADIHLNAKDYEFSFDGEPRRAGTVDFRSVVVHELGHALGLGHSSDPTATMFPTGSGLRWRSLEPDDEAGVCALYPGVGDEGCDSQPCPDGWVCVARACQRPRAAQDVCSPCNGPADCEAAGSDARCVEVMAEGGGSAVGRACGRACTDDASCGAGFHCRDATEAGDRQCFSDTGCQGSANRCTGDADCSVGTCVSGVCLGPLPATDVDGGLPGAEASPAPPADPSSDDGCALTGEPDAGSGWLAGFTLFGALVLRRPRRSRAPR